MTFLKMIDQGALNIAQELSRVPYGRTLEMIALYRDLERRYVAKMGETEARVEKAAIEEAGGPKALGSNVEDRHRELVLACEASAEYRNMRQYVNDTLLILNLLYARRDTLRYEQKERLIEAKVNARDIGEDPTDV